MNLEDLFIKQFAKSSHLIGDDGALSGRFVYSKDMFFENVHFQRKWMGLKEIAYRAMMVNISDAVAMNAKPLYALLGVAIPKNVNKMQAKELAKGFLQAAHRYSIEIIGGDTIENSKLDISVTLVSTCNKPLLRKGMRKNHLLAYTGKLGNSKKELMRLLRGGRVHKSSKFRDIVLRDKFVAKAQRYLSAGMDISDGIFSDLGKLSSVNNSLGYRFFAKMPQGIGCSGEEYEMLVSFDVRNRKSILRRAVQTRTPLSVFAKAVRKKYVNRCKSHHF
jgi:thiamine-monophosphate kinase